MNHIVGDNTAEWDARVLREQQRKKRLAHRAHIGLGAGLLLGLVALALVVMVQPKKPPAVAASIHTPAKAGNPAELRIPPEESFNHEPGSDELKAQVQILAVGLARIWRSGKSEEAATTAQSYTVEYERAVGCDLRWIAGRAGPGVWQGTLSLVRSLHEITPFVGRAREGKAVVVTAITCPDEREALQLKLAGGEQRPSRR
ncbi:MAG TPA: hypothetical protein VGZ50_03475 [Actinomycetota bacterium]|nr:hypothetical protein [Actinomycetota bacterium]